MGQILLFVLKNPSQVFSLLSSVMELISSGITWVEIQGHVSSFKKAAEKAETQKDATDLEAIFRKPSDNP